MRDALRQNGLDSAECKLDVDTFLDLRLVLALLQVIDVERRARRHTMTRALWLRLSAVLVASALIYGQTDNSPYTNVARVDRSAGQVSQLGVAS